MQLGPVSGVVDPSLAEASGLRPGSGGGCARSQWVTSVGCVGDDGLDAEKLGVLRSWGVGLERDERSEVAAAGRAILMLVDEIERLHVLMWDRHLYPGQIRAGPLSERLLGRVRGDSAGTSDFEAVQTSLLQRLRERFARQPRDNG